MAKARVCDVCGNIMTGKRNIVRVLELEEGAEARDTKTLESYDLHPECVAKLEAWLSNAKVKEVS